MTKVTRAHSTHHHTPPLPSCPEPEHKEKSSEGGAEYHSEAIDKHAGSIAGQLETLINQHMAELTVELKKELTDKKEELERVRKERDLLFSQMSSGGGRTSNTTSESVLKETGTGDKEPPPPPSVKDFASAPISAPGTSAPEMSSEDDKEQNANQSTRFPDFIETKPSRPSFLAHHDDHRHGLDPPKPHKDEKAKKGAFADASAMKEQVRKAVMKKEYNVCDFYYDTGRSQQIARAQWFEYATLVVIAFNALWISIDADLNTGTTMLDAPPIFQVAEHSFCIYFTMEWTIRFLSFRQKRNCIRDAWFVFDSALVLMMVAETWIMTIVLLATGAGGSGGLGNTSVLKLVRLVRLTRMARMAKLLRAIPELIILIKGVAIASRSVGFALVLLTILIYFFAIVFRQLSDDTDLGDMYFKTVPESMLSLLLDAVLPDQAQMVRDCNVEGALYGILMLLFMFCSCIMLMNMLIGVLCEVVSVVSAVEKEELTVGYVKQRMHQLFSEVMDCDKSMTVSRLEFQKMLLVPEAAQIINEIGVDAPGLVDFADFIFHDGGDLSFADFMEVVLSFRGSNGATVKDIVDMRKFTHSEFTLFKDSINETLSGITKVINRDFHAVEDQLKRNKGAIDENHRMLADNDKDDRGPPRDQMIGNQKFGNHQHGVDMNHYYHQSSNENYISNPAVSMQGGALKFQNSPRGENGPLRSPRFENGVENSQELIPFNDTDGRLPVMMPIPGMGTQGRSFQNMNNQGYANENGYFQGMTNQGARQRPASGPPGRMPAGRQGSPVRQQQGRHFSPPPGSYQQHGYNNYQQYDNQQHGYTNGESTSRPASPQRPSTQQQARPGAYQRPGSSQSTSSQRMQRQRWQQPLPGNHRNRPVSPMLGNAPALPEFSQRLWIGEDEIDTVVLQDKNGGMLSSNNLRVAPVRKQV
jgi:hypothetical protein